MPDPLKSLSPSRPPANASTSRQNDAAIMSLMGGFFVLLALLVLVSLFWDHDFQGRVVTAAAAAILGGIGFLMLGLGRKLRRAPPRIR